MSHSPQHHSPQHIVFTGGGTAGHLMPGLAVVEELRRRDPRVRITFAGDGKPLHRQLVAAAGAEYLDLPCRRLPRRLREAVTFARGEISGYRAARKFLRQQPADTVVGLGGFASVPMALAAVHQGVPLVLLEQNVVPGKATRWLVRFAKAVCVSFPETSRHLPRGCASHMTGNPVRRAFHAAALFPPMPSVGLSPRAMRGTGCKLLVLGGSGGAESLNRAVPEALGVLLRASMDLSEWQIVHQAGDREVDATARRYALAGVSARVVAWIGEMPAAMHCSDLAISRAGGTTLAELAAARLPAILVPYPRAADDHQRANAAAMAAQPGFIVVDEEPVPPMPSVGLSPRMAMCSFPERLAAGLRRLVSHPSTPTEPIDPPSAAASVASLLAGLPVAAE